MQALIEQAKAASPHAWEQLFRSYKHELSTYIHSLVDDRDAALDLLQETFLHAYQSIAALQDNAKFGPWIYRIAYHRALNHLRQKRGNPLSLDTNPAQPAATGSAIHDLDAQQEFAGYFQKLTPDHRAVVMLYFVENRSYEEIADILECNIGTVKSRLHYAKEKLKTLMAGTQE